VTVVQFIIMLVSGLQPNERLADFGTTLGIWIAKAARYQTAASEVRPWPWSELD
jgi:succinate-acetate transporter protein